MPPKRDDCNCSCSLWKEQQTILAPNWAFSSAFYIRKFLNSKFNQGTTLQPAQHSSLDHGRWILTTAYLERPTRAEPLETHAHTLPPAHFICICTDGEITRTTSLGGQHAIPERAKPSLFSSQVAELLFSFAQQKESAGDFIPALVTAASL